ncbi:MAG: hypothetical protein ACM31D_02910 [Bacteroidota bacterium]
MAFFALDPSSTPMRGQVHVGYAKVTLGLAVAGTLLTLERGWGIPLGLLCAALTLWYFLCHRASVTIVDGLVHVKIGRLSGRALRLQEQLTHYVTLRHRFETVHYHESAQNWHLLELLHRDIPERTVPLFRSTDFADVAKWQASLALALGVETTEIASNGLQVVQPHDILRPLAETSPLSPCPSPPPDLDVRMTSRGTVITLPSPAHVDRRGVRVAIAILALPTLATLLALPPTGIPIALLLAACGALLFLLVQSSFHLGADRPAQTTRLVLTAHGLALDFRHFMPGRHRAVIPWSRVHVVVITPEQSDILTIRTSDRCFVTPPGLSRPALEWMAAAIVGAAHGQLPA